MEWGDLCQVDIAQEDYQAKEIRILQSEGQDYYKPMYSMGVDNVQRPTLYIPAIASPHPRGYMANTYQSPSGTIVNAANLLQAQSNYIQQPQFDKNMSFGSHFPATYYLQDSRAPSTYNVHNEVQNGSLYHPKKIDIDSRRTNGAFHNWDSSLGGLGDARYANVDHYNCHQGPEAASRTHSHQEATLPNMKQVNLYGIRSENATVTSIAKGQNSTVRTSQAELSDQGNVSKMSSVIKKRNSGAPSACNAHNSFQNGSLYHPKKIDLSSPPLGCGGNNEDRYQRNVYGYGLNMGGQTSSKNDCRRTNGAVHSGDSSLGGFGDASLVKANHCNCLQGPEAASRPYSHQEATLPNMKQVNLYGIRSEYATVSMSVNSEERFMSHVKSHNHSTPSSHQVRQSKFKSQPSQKPSKQPSKQKVLKHHIMSNGFHNPATQPFGQNCRLCNGDLAFSPIDDKELYSSLLPEFNVHSTNQVSMSRTGSSKDIVTRKNNEQNFFDVQNGNNTTVRASRVAPKHHQGNVSKISSVSYRPKSLGLQIGNNGTVRTSQVEPNHQRNVSKLSSVPPNRAKSSGIHYSNNNPVSTSLAGPKNQGNVSKISSVSYRKKPSGVHFSNYNTVGTSQVRPKNQVNVSKVSSVLDKQNPSEVQQHDEKNAVKTSQVELSSDSPTARAKRLIKAYIQTDKTTYTPQHRSTQKSKDFMPPVKNRQRHNTPSSQVWQMKVEIPPSEKPSKVTMQPSKNQSGQSHSTPSSHQVWRKKVETHPSERQYKVKMQPSKKQSMVKKQPSRKPSKQQSKQNVPSYHIVWDGFDDDDDDSITEPFGQNCPLCDDDLAYSPTDDEELYSSVLPEVAVLSCGHSFHCQCLLLVSSEEQSTDPPCFICVNDLPLTNQGNSF
ncbi:hypothetical protein SO802_000540 [Lithocarpus litseifolius]|uniref:RING-type domain-containing protein n=1 Tax=Lithocarpus litseifolius TaxID=425828 RepID=A0AAW2DX17_9ROSI